jgi:ABC-type nitrate/sulfonate/bicarbonate transport system substrate-binding protein
MIFTYTSWTGAKGVANATLVRAIEQWGDGSVLIFGPSLCDRTEAKEEHKELIERFLKALLDG